MNAHLFPYSVRKQKYTNQIKYPYLNGLCNVLCFLRVNDENFIVSIYIFFEALEAFYITIMKESSEQLNVTVITLTQPAFTCSKLIIETLEQGAIFV